MVSGSEECDGPEDVGGMMRISRGLSRCRLERNMSSGETRPFFLQFPWQRASGGMVMADGSLRPFDLRSGGGSLPQHAVQHAVQHLGVLAWLEQGNGAGATPEGMA